MVDRNVGRRRSQRLFIQVPVILEAQIEGKPSLNETTQTIVVNAHGALVETRTVLEPGQKVVLSNARTRDTSECVVKIVTAAEPGKFHVALEFTTPNPSFWHVTFPPEDWSKSHPHAKKGA